MKNHRIVSWTNHGIYGAGETIDEAFGLIETVEKNRTNIYDFIRPCS